MLSTEESDVYQISTHAPLAGRDIVIGVKVCLSPSFQPTRPLRGATERTSPPSARTRHFNPRAPCGARHRLGSNWLWDLRISTHAPLAGRDFWPFQSPAHVHISTHAPLAGRDFWPFQSQAHVHISTHAPLAGRDSTACSSFDLDFTFQPTRPLRGATISPLSSTGYCTGFQPTRPLRGATVPRSQAAAEIEISTHAPLAGRDISAA